MALLQTIPGSSVSVSPIQFGKGPEFYQNGLSNSYLDDVVIQHKPVTRYSLKGKVYEIRDSSQNDISNIALRDGQMGSLLIGDASPVRKMIASAERPDIPLGFYLGRNVQEQPTTLEMFYHYVSPKYREQGIGSLLRADLLQLALDRKNIDRVLSMQRATSSFYELLDGICSAFKRSGFWQYELDLSDKEKARTIIAKRLKEFGVEALK